MAKASASEPAAFLSATPPIISGSKARQGTATAAIATPCKILKAVKTGKEGAASMPNVSGKILHHSRERGRINIDADAGDWKDQTRNIDNFFMIGSDKVCI